MEFDKSRIYTAVNADELKIGSKVICADNIKDLKYKVSCSIGLVTSEIDTVLPECKGHRFFTDDGYVWALAYLVEEPEEPCLKWTDLKVGDVLRISSCNIIRLVDAIDTSPDTDRHIHLSSQLGWIYDTELKDFELVTESNNG